MSKDNDNAQQQALRRIQELELELEQVKKNREIKLVRT